MMAVLRSIGLDYMNLSIIELHRKSDTIDRVAGTDLIEQPLLVGRVGSRYRELRLNVIEKRSTSRNCG